MWYLIGLIWIALIAGIVWSYRRKRTQHDAERARQFDVLYADLKLNRGGGAAEPSAVAPVAIAPPAAVPVIPAPAARAPEYSRKPRLLGQPDAMLYLVFRTGLPDHEIFAHVPLEDAIEIADSLHGYERDQRARRLARLRVDLIVCNKQFEVVAAVTLSRDGEQDPEQVENARFIEQCLRAARIRVIRIGRAALPRHHQVRELVYGPEA